jgi:hypothetical protein
MKKIISLIAIGLVVLLTIGFVSAYQGNPNVLGPEFDEERHLAMQEVFENMDYTAWVALMQDKGRITEVITEENFDQFVAMHDAKLNGDTETVDSIRDELGLGQGSRRGLRDGSGRERGQRKEHGQKNCLN